MDVELRVKGNTISEVCEPLKKHLLKRVSEAQADDCGIGILHAGCFDIRAASSMMAKVGEASGHTRASWTDTHPPPLERVEHLQRRAVALAEEGTHQDCRSVVQLLKRLYRASTRSKREFA